MLAADSSICLHITSAMLLRSRSLPDILRLSASMSDASELRGLQTMAGLTSLRIACVFLAIGKLKQRVLVRIFVGVQTESEL